MESITLYCRQGGSDKVYQITLQPREGGWSVDYAFGRRGSTLSTGTKTQIPQSLEKARRIYETLIRRKTAKGYFAGEEGEAYSNGSQEDTGIRPQLLNPVEETEIERLLADPHFLLQEKMDGRRLLIGKQGDRVVCINRRGLECGLPDSIRRSALSLKGNFLMDGEGIGDIFHVFDLLELDGNDLRCRTYNHRLSRLLVLLGTGPAEHIPLVPSYMGAQKRVLFERLRKYGAEGVVFKKTNALYVPDRPASGGDQLKFKFVKTVSAVVFAHNEQRSIALALWHKGRLIPAGNVTIPPNQPVPGTGQVVEVQYLYATPETGILYQPVYLGVRDDIQPSECLRTQLKFKAVLPISPSLVCLAA